MSECELSLSDHKFVSPHCFVPERSPIRAQLTWRDILAAVHSHVWARTFKSSPIAAQKKV